MTLLVYTLRLPLAADKTRFEPWDIRQVNLLPEAPWPGFLCEALTAAAGMNLYCQSSAFPPLIGHISTPS